MTQGQVSVSFFPYTTLFRSQKLRGPVISRSHIRISTDLQAQYRADRRRLHGYGQSRCRTRSEEHTSELQSRFELVCRLLLEKKKLRYFTQVNLLVNVPIIIF